jgi:hypothetical protein
LNATLPGHAILFTLVVAGLILTAGCTQGTSSIVQENFDDDNYLTILNEYVSTQPAPELTDALFVEEIMAMDELLAMDELKIRSVSYSTRVGRLNVSSQFEYSKNSFLQALKGSDAVADYLSSHSLDERRRLGRKEFHTAAEKAEYEEFVQNGNEKEIFFMKTFDSSVCSAGRNFVNITEMCNKFSTIPK